MSSLDKLAYTSTIRMKNPNEKLCFSILFLFLCIFSNDIVMSSLVFLTMGIMTVFVAKISLRVYLKLLLLPLFFTLFGVLGVVFAQWSSSLSFQENNMLIYLSLLLKALASTSCLYFLILTTILMSFGLHFLCPSKIRYSIRRIAVPANRLCQNNRICPLATFHRLHQPASLYYPLSCKTGSNNVLLS